MTLVVLSITTFSSRPPTHNQKNEIHRNRMEIYFGFNRKEKS
jgi:hypothetical protein